MRRTVRNLLLLIGFAIAAVLSHRRLTLLPIAEREIVTQIQREGATQRRPSLLVFITTHVSPIHIRAVRDCWPYLARSTPLLGMADLLIFSTAKHMDGTQKMQDALETVFVNATGRKHRNITAFHFGSSLAKQHGANTAVQEAVRRGMFDAYDWVVRINPDVLIYNDTYLLDTMTNDINASGVFTICVSAGSGKNRTNKWVDMPHNFEVSQHWIPGMSFKINTDFFAVRSKYLRGYELYDSHINAELLTTKHFKIINEQGGDRYLPDVGVQVTICRVGDTKKWGSPVIHSHEFLWECPRII